MVTLMTRDEMVERLGNGEDALDLSIEKWERNIEWLKKGMPFDEVPYGFDTCALCYTAGYRGGGFACTGCRYFAYYGEECWSDEQGPYAQFAEAIGNAWESPADLDMLCMYAEDMRDELLEIKEAECARPSS